MIDESWAESRLLCEQCGHWFVGGSRYLACHQVCLNCYYKEKITNDKDKDLIPIEIDKH